MNDAMYDCHSIVIAGVSGDIAMTQSLSSLAVSAGEEDHHQLQVQPESSILQPDNLVCLVPAETVGFPSGSVVKNTPAMQELQEM